MGFILKFIIFAVAAYTVWNTASRWFKLLGGNRRSTMPPRTPAPGSSPGSSQAPREAAPMRGRVVEDTHQCPVCSAYMAVGTAKCGRPDCPQ
jgi:hypothetical protein